MAQIDDSHVFIGMRAILDASAPVPSAPVPYGIAFKDTFYVPPLIVMSLGGNRFIILDGPHAGRTFMLTGDHRFLLRLPDAPK